MNMHHAHKNKLVDASGMKSVMAKLTDQDVIEMRKKYANGGYTQEQLAKPFGMSRRHVGDIINRVCWKHI
jgi:DNA-binding transcriptional regulator LsrR (DeoR family)